MGHSLRPRSIGRNGFTIVELLIVIAVVGVLAAITLNTFAGSQARARDAQRSSDVKALKKAVELYRVEKGFYPSPGADDSGEQLANIAAALQPYMKAMPADPQAASKPLSYNYVRGPVENESYAVRIDYESKPSCKTGSNMNPGWWGTGLPTCPTL